MNRGLFDELPAQAAPAPAGGGRPRLRVPERRQVEVQMLSLDERLPADHRARQVWAFVEALDLSALYAGVRAVAGGPGHPPADPRLLVALWLFATLDGVGSARALERLCREQVAYQWLCGGVSVNHHTLADFRVAHAEVLERLLADSVAGLVHAGLVALDEVVQDGVRVRAAAGAASFHRPATLARARSAARARLAALKAELASDPAAGERRRRAAELRAARQRAERLDKALEAARRLAAEADGDRDGDGSGGGDQPPARGGGRPVRVSATDPEARVMRLADGGYRPAYNVQIASTPGAGQVVLAVAPTTQGSDLGQLAPMHAALCARYGRAPKRMLADGNFAKLADIETLEAAGTQAHVPPPRPRRPGRERYLPLPGDSPALAAWRARPATAEGRAVYRRRSTGECINALWRNRGLRQLTVRGLGKARAVVLWHALAHNLLRTFALAGAATP